MNCEVFICMRKTVLLGEQIFKMKQLLNEGVSNHLIVVDIQPEYEAGFTFNINEFCNKLNHIIDEGVRVTMLYNGADTIGMIDKNDYIIWLLENGLDEENLGYINMYDKGYAFFRYCMDEGVNEDEITNLVRFMMKHQINDSREITEEFWDMFEAEYSPDDIRELVEYADDCINIPELMDYLDDIIHGTVYLTGGGVNECLKEVEIALNAMNKPYIIYPEFTY